MGQFSCIYYNLHVAPSITAQAKSVNCAATIALESFMANNVKFRSLNEVVTFIHNVINEERVFNDSDFLDQNIEVATCFEHIIMTCGHGYCPSEKELDIIWDLVHRQPQTIINRLFYKNNLFAFIENSSMTGAVINLLESMDSPYLDPNKAPKAIRVEIETFWEIVKEFVFYNHGYIDRIQRVAYLPRKVSMAIDTDSELLGA